MIDIYLYWTYFGVSKESDDGDEIARNADEDEEDAGADCKVEELIRIVGKEERPIWRNRRWSTRPNDIDGSVTPSFSSIVTVHKDAPAAVAAAPTGRRHRRWIPVRTCIDGHNVPLFRKIVNGCRQYNRCSTTCSFESFLCLYQFSINRRFRMTFPSSFFSISPSLRKWINKNVEKKVIYIFLIESNSPRTRIEWKCGIIRHSWVKKREIWGSRSNLLFYISSIFKKISCPLKIWLSTFIYSLKGLYINHELSEWTKE